MISDKLTIPETAIKSFCEKWQVAELALFGSAVRDDFSADSDVDVLVTFSPAARPTLFDLVEMTDDLEAIFGRQVDLVTRPSVEASANYLRRRAILDTAEVIYACQTI
jgi:hypothetical protein